MTEIALKPAVVVELQLYGEEEIARWDAGEALPDGERARILANLPAARTALSRKE